METDGVYEDIGRGFLNIRSFATPYVNYQVHLKEHTNHNRQRRVFGLCPP